MAIGTGPGALAERREGRHAVRRVRTALPLGHVEVNEFKDIRASEQRGIVIIHQELALSPFLSL
ncbi:hypothetical protein ACWDRX_10395, partial [Streptomyces nigra]